jgi:hypothetical protein
MLTRREILCAVGSAGALTLLPRTVHSNHDASQLPPLIESLVTDFVNESSPDGGVERAKSRWQKPGRGAAVGSDMFPGGIDPRYFRFEVEALYRIARLTGRGELTHVANRKVEYIAKNTHAKLPTWALANALELLGVINTFNPSTSAPDSGTKLAKRFIEFARARSVKVTTIDGVTFRHFPCGYGIAQFGAKDAGWTNDLSMLGSGLVHAYELTGDKSILDDAVSFAEYFVQPWRPRAIGKDGYWQCGTWHEQLGTWVIGPSHYSGFESTDAHADEAGWVFSTNTCIDYLSRLHKHRPDERYADRCFRGSAWTFHQCQFEDGAVGMCTKDDKWLGTTGAAITQAAKTAATLRQSDDARLQELRAGADRAKRYLESQMKTAKIEGHGVQWVTRKTSTDPLVNVAMLWTMALVGWLDGADTIRGE